MNHLDRALSALLRPFGVSPGLGLAILGTALVVAACATGSPAQAAPEGPPTWFTTRNEVCDRHGNLLVYWGYAGNTGGGIVRDEPDCFNLPEGSPPR